MALLGILVLALPVWKANRIGRQRHRIEGAQLSEGNHPVVRELQQSILARLKPNEWTRTDQTILFLGYGLTLGGQMLTFLY